MKLIRGRLNKALVASSALTIGNFDGVHLGHQTLLADLKNAAARAKVPAVVMVFEPFPAEFFNRSNMPSGRVISLRDKLRLLESFGVDAAVVMHFNQGFAAIDAESFVAETLVKGLGLKHLIIGDDFRFGCRRSGDFNLLQSMSNDYGFEVEAKQSVLTANNTRVSSSAIRTCLAAGELVSASQMLGYEYTVTGRVHHGLKLGRQLGYPTANIQFPHFYLAIRGIYAVELQTATGNFKAVASIGTRPTIGGELAPLLEVHCLDASPSLYGQIVSVKFKQFIRAEKKLDGLESLKKQIAADIQIAREYFIKSS